MSDNDVKKILEELRALRREVTLSNPYYFPRSPDWMWYPVKIKNRKIGPKETFTIWDKPGQGWLYWAVCVTDDPNLVLKFEAYAEMHVDIEFTIEWLYNLGLLNLGQGFFNVSKYGDTDYVVTYAPTGLGVPFNGLIRSTAFNPQDYDITVKLFQAWLIVFK